jgi:hypothetical protein
MIANIQNIKKALRKELKDYLIDKACEHKFDDGEVCKLLPVYIKAVRGVPAKSAYEIYFTIDKEKIPTMSNHFMVLQFQHDMVQKIGEALRQVYNCRQNHIDLHRCKISDVEFGFVYLHNNY